MIHRCNVECHKHDTLTQELTGDTESIWLKFSFLLDTVVAIKETSSDTDDFNYKTTTVYMDENRSYIIDTPFTVFEKIWIEFVTGESIDDYMSNNNAEL